MNKLSYLIIMINKNKRMIHSGRWFHFRLYCRRMHATVPSGDKICTNKSVAFHFICFERFPFARVVESEPYKMSLTDEANKYQCEKISRALIFIEQVENHATGWWYFISWNVRTSHWVSRNAHSIWISLSGERKHNQKINRNTFEKAVHSLYFVRFMFSSRP